MSNNIKLVKGCGSNQIKSNISHTGTYGSV